MKRLLLACLCAAFTAPWTTPPSLAVAAQIAVVPNDGVMAPLLTALERALLGGDPAAYLSLLHPAADRARAAEFSTFEIRPGATRAAVRERDRQPVDDADPGAGQLLVLDAFTEYGDRARVSAWLVRAIPTSDGWRISAQERMSTVDSLYKLSLDVTRRFRARDFMIRAEDLELTLHDGHAYVVRADTAETGLILVGRGEMRFRPEPAAERRQVEIFGGDEVLETRFDTAFIRAANLDAHVDRSSLQEVTLEARELQQAQRVFAAESSKTYVLELGDLTSDTWSILPAPGDFVAELDTRRFDSLTYVRASSEPEDIMLFDRANQRTISSYRSRARLASAGRFFNEQTTAQYDVIDYDVDAAFTPGRLWIDGRTRMRIRTRENFGGQMNVRLADSLAVYSVESQEFGRLFSLRARGQNLVVINLPGVVLPGTEFSITVTYGGYLAPQSPDREAVAPDQAGPASQSDRGQGGFVVRPPTTAMAGEPVFLYSSRSYWYPQNPVAGYATARLRITAPSNLSIVATGVPSPDGPRSVPGPDGTQPRRVHEFTAERPVRYLAFIASRLIPVDRVTLALAPERVVQVKQTGSPAGPATFAPPAISGAVHESLALAVEANPLQAAAGRAVVDRAADVVQFYHSLIGDAPYGSFTLALVESAQPGGHSPAYFATLNQRLLNAPPVWRADPVNFPSFPELYLAHEVAHQWWGQGVGWQNYHEQWLSEGIAQYFAALYAHHSRGPQVFGDVLRQMREWAIEHSNQGPVYLGYRLGHLRKDSRVFRALVYNKGAAVLHMLRRLIGDEPFFRGLQRFYVSARYRRVGTEDLRHAMETEADRSLGRFFERWIHEAGIPRIELAYLVRSAPVREVAVRLQQTGDLIYDLPVTLTLEFENRTSRDVVVPMSGKLVELTIPLDAPLRNVRISERDGTLATVRRVGY